MRFKFEGNQKLWIAKNGHPVTIIGRTEFFDGRQNRYCVQSDTHIPGKNMNQDWTNEDQLSATAPVIETPAAAPVEQPKSSRRPGIRKRGLGSSVRAQGN